MKTVRRFVLCLLSALLLISCMSGCMSANMDESNNTLKSPLSTGIIPKIPDELDIDENGIPILSVYDHSIDEISRMDVETYVMGVVAGEMKNDWPEEALKAQAILARTFVLKFVDEKESRYENADISTDIEEAQAYSQENVNDRVKNAVESTRGLIMNADGDFPHAWFHAHSGGMTELPSVALDFKGDDPDYLVPVNSGESSEAPDNVKHWEAKFSDSEVIKAANESGLDITSLESIQIGRKGQSGRAATLTINGQDVSAPTFRIRIGANKLKSTMIEDVRLDNEQVIFAGKGFGHGVGMSQWGAYAMAEAGKNAVQIIEYYFPGTTIAKLW